MHSSEGKEIRDARKRVGITQVQLSEATGIDQASISRMENGRQGITLEYLKRIARALGVNLGDLVGDAGRH
jgi:UDP-N-acetylglucosamine 1-carboxyvinyltransferase